MSLKIDFVIPWVDGSDTQWLNKFNQYAPVATNCDTRKCNYRDFDLLRYWFRGVEKFAPWVHKIYFITCGQKPSWLNLANKKLVWVKHEDYISNEYLPLFNSQAIEVGINKIQGLSEYFVYFNDDFYLIDNISPNFFFKGGLPRDMWIMSPLIGGTKSLISYTQLSNCAIINEYFSKKKSISRYLTKYFNMHYGLENLRNLLMLPFPFVSTFLNHHFAQPFLKSVFDEVWDKFPEQCSMTQSSRFREPLNVNQWLFRYWQLMSGQFVPTNLKKKRKYYTLGVDFKNMCDDIKFQKYNEIVINDAGYDMTKNEIEKLIESFDFILPEKSSFERK